jgi:hypothetical protein
MQKLPRLPATILLACLLAFAVGCSGGESDPLANIQSEKAHDAPDAAIQGSPVLGPWHRVSGTVGNIDREKGMLTLNAQPAALRLWFASEALADLKDGDRITAQMTFAEGTHATRAYDAPAELPSGDLHAREGELGHRSLTGTVQEIDYEKGVFGFRADGELLTLSFPPMAIRDLNYGDRITVHLAFTKGSAAS